MAVINRVLCQRGAREGGKHGAPRVIGFDPDVQLHCGERVCHRFAGQTDDVVGSEGYRSIMQIRCGRFYLGGCQPLCKYCVPQRFTSRFHSEENGAAAPLGKPPGILRIRGNDISADKTNERKIHFTFVPGKEVIQPGLAHAENIVRKIYRRDIRRFPKLEAFFNDPVNAPEPDVFSLSGIQFAKRILEAKTAVPRASPRRDDVTDAPIEPVAEAVIQVAVGKRIRVKIFGQRANLVLPNLAILVPDILNRCERYVAIDPIQQFKDRFFPFSPHDHIDSRLRNHLGEKRGMRAPEDRPDTEFPLNLLCSGNCPAMAPAHHRKADQVGLKRCDFLVEIIDRFSKRQPAFVSGRTRHGRKIHWAEKLIVDILQKEELCHAVLTFRAHTG